MRILVLKIAPEFFQPIEDGIKNFDVRFNDRDYKVGDVLCLAEFDGKAYSGRYVYVEVTYILDDPRYCLKGHVIMGIKKFNFFLDNK